MTMLHSVMNRRAAANAMRGLVLGCMIAAVFNAVGRAEPAAGTSDLKIGSGDLALVLGANPSPAAQRAGELFAERAQERSGVTLAAPPDKGTVRLVIGTVASNDQIKEFVAAHEQAARLGADGYCISADPRARVIHVAGQSDSGVVAGVGRLMRELRYGEGGLEVPSLLIAETPKMPNRGIYLWARKYYFDKPDLLDRYIEEFALWGGNGIAFWFEMGMFESFADTTGEKSELNTGYAKAYKLDKSLARDWITLYRRFYATARRLGMKTGLIMAANDAYMSSPKELRIEPIIGCPEWYLCPSKPGSVEKMLAWQEEVFRALAPLDIYNIFPADAGGCSCKECTPWPSRGLSRIALAMGNRIHEISPQTEIWLDTWHLNHPTFGGQDWKNLVDSLDSTKQPPAWFTGFEVGLAPKHGYAKMSAEDRDYYNKAGRPLMVFPEISMWGNHPGMLVNKAYWKQLQDEWNSYSPELMKGGWVYSERWNTDVACVTFLSWYGNPRKSVDTVLDEYASFYFGAEAAAGRQLLELLDDANQDPDRKAKIRTTVAALDASLPAWAKRDWRWQEIVTSCNRFK